MIDETTLRATAKELSKHSFVKAKYLNDLVENGLFTILQESFDRYFPTVESLTENKDFLGDIEIKIVNFFVEMLHDDDIDQSDVSSKVWFILEDLLVSTRDSYKKVKLI